MVFGANGLLGSSLCPYLQSAGFQIFTAGRSKTLDYEIDMFNLDSLQRLFDLVKPDHVINLIAATNVDQCEVDPAMAAKINTLIPTLISRATDANNIHLVQVSTDQVYEGIGDHIEENVAPLNVYGLSKLAGELSMDQNRTAVLRTNFYGRSVLSHRSGFSDWIVRSLREGENITLFKDVHFSALHMNSLSYIIQKVLSLELVGTFNAGCRNSISKADFALILASELGLQKNSAIIGSLSDLPMRARRPLDMTLNITKIEKALGIECPDILQEIVKTAKEYVNA